MPFGESHPVSPEAESCMHAFDSAGNLTLSLFFPYLSPSPSHISWAVPSLSLSLSLSPMLSLKWAQPGLGLLCRRSGSMDGERGARRARARLCYAAAAAAMPFHVWMDVVCVVRRSASAIRSWVGGTPTSHDTLFKTQLYFCWTCRFEERGNFFVI